MNREVNYAFLHQTIFVPGAGNLTATLEPNRLTGVKMLYTSDGLLVEYKGVSFVVPLANVACAVFSETGQISLLSTSPPKSK